MVVYYITYIYFNLYLSSSNILNLFFTFFVKSNLTAYLNQFIPPSQLQHQSNASFEQINGCFKTESKIKPSINTTACKAKLSTPIGIKSVILLLESVYSLKGSYSSHFCFFWRFSFDSFFDSL